MAKKLRKLQERGPGRPAAYPWDRWLDGKPWKLIQGEDFSVSLRSMDNNIRKAAERKGLQVRVRMEPPTCICLQASEPGEDC